MTITRLLLDEMATATRAVAMAGDTPVATFVEGLALAQGARPGDIMEARLRAPGPSRRQSFVELETGEDALLKSAVAKSSSLGMAVHVEVTAQARAGKLANVRAVPADTAANGPHLERWRTALPDAARALSFETGRDAREEIDAAFDMAMAPSAVLPGGGTLHIARSRALTAIDIDTAGRRDTADAATRAMAINSVAVRAAARQLSLRRLGGLVVIDCIAPISRTNGQALRKAFLDAHRGASTSKASALAPSPFGLLETSIGWRDTPLDEVLAGARGIAFDGLLALEKRAASNGGAFCHLALPGAAFTCVWEQHAAIKAALASKYGARLDISEISADTFEVSSR